MNDLNSLRTFHQLLAWKVLFTEEQVIVSEIGSHCATTDEQLARFEKAKLNSENKMRVVCYIFAKCTNCVADCLQSARIVLRIVCKVHELCCGLFANQLSKGTEGLLCKCRTDLSDFGFVIKGNSEWEKNWY